MHYIFTPPPTALRCTLTPSFFIYWTYNSEQIFCLLYMIVAKKNHLDRFYVECGSTEAFAYIL